MTIYHNNSGKELNISLEGEVIININQNSEKYFKFLGFRIDNKLNWNHHIKHVSNKLKAINFIILSISKN